MKSDEENTGKQTNNLAVKQKGRIMCRDQEIARQLTPLCEWGVKIDQDVSIKLDRDERIDERTRAK